MISSLNRFATFSMADTAPFHTKDGIGGEVRVHPLFAERADFGEGTHTGLVLSGRAILSWGGEHYPLREGMYFCAPGSMVLTCQESSKALVISKADAVGLFQIGGPIEAHGRLRYIDGCTDSLVLSPPRLGDPCLNHLHIPAGTQQSAHVHPSVRVGAIVRGSGICRGEEGEFPLDAGLGWVIPAGYRHSFHTTDHSLDVLAWHPDSDFGPTDEDHPMINRTVL